MKLFITLICLSIIINCYGVLETNSIPDSLSNKRIELKELILPVSLITYGIIGLESHFLRFYNYEIKEEVGEHIDNKQLLMIFPNIHHLFLYTS